MIEAARQRTKEHADRISYEVVDATDEDSLLALGDLASFDAAHCAMALFDMAQIEPLFRAVAALLRPRGRFLSSVIHPAFNNNGSVIFHETDQSDISVRRGVRVWQT
jgi:SAM-dependent methyltransferase